MELATWVFAMIDVQTCIILLTTLLLTIWFIDLNHGRRMPPGPLQWPFIGCMPQLALHGKDPVAYLMSLGKKHKGLFSIKMGSYHTIYISDFAIMKEAFVKNADCFSNRPNNYHEIEQFVNIIGSKGIINENGQKWKILKRFAIVTLRDLGVGKKSLEERIQDEAQSFAVKMEQNAGKSSIWSNSIAMAVTNIICSIIFGDRYDYENKDFKSIIYHMDTMVTASSDFEPAYLLWILQFLPPSQRVKKSFDTVKAIKKIILQEITQHKATYDPDAIRDLIDLCLQKQEEETDNHVLDDDTLCAVIFDLFLAGSETTTTTLKWAILYMVEHPDIQKKCQEEVDKVLGTQAPLMTDRPKLPFIVATIAEIQRITTIAPFGLPHAAAYETELAGYRIPKDTMVIPLLHAVNVDPDGWKDPDVFRPERFLDDSGVCKKPENLLPFGIGPRMCTGEPLARMELFIFFTMFLQKFKFSKAFPDQDIDLTPHLGFTQSPKPQDIFINVR